ncbi:MAG TPA: tetratricopeptide repeat protein, partial [Pirellulales bacterium]
NKRGEKDVGAGDEKAALKDFEAAVTFDPNYWRALHNRAVSRAGLGDAKGALADFDSVIRMNAGYANAWFNRGELKYAKGDFQQALDDYNQAIQLQPGDAGFYESRGHAQYRLGRLREALTDYNRAAQLDPNDATVLVDRGDAYREQALYQPAAADYRESIRINPKLGRAYLSAAWLMATCPDARFRETDKAISAAQKAIDLDGDKDYRYLDTLAAAQANAGQFDAAKKSANQALAITPGKETAHVRQRLEFYEGSRAYREGAPAEPVRAAAVSRTP